MNCPVCGQELPDVGATCPRCGHVESPWAPRPYDTIATAHQAPAAQVQAAPGGYGDPEQYLAAHPETRVDSYPVVVAPQKKRSRLFAVLIGALCLVLIGSGVAVADVPGAPGEGSWSVRLVRA